MTASKEVTIKPFESHSPRKARFRWVVYFSRGQGERRGEKLFETKDKAKAFAKDKRIEILNTGLGQGSLNDVELREALWARDSLEEFGIGIQDAVQYFIHRKRLEVSSITVTEAIPLLLEQKEAEKLSLRHIQAMRQRIKRFAVTFGDRLVADISTREITAWLNKIKGKDSTRNAYRTYLGVFFSWAVKQEYLKKDPVKNTTAIKIPETDSVEVYTVAEMQSLLAKAPEALIPFLAIGAFAGVRVSELKELDWKNINLLKKQITIIASIAKTGKKRVIPMYPVLKRFLKPYAQASGKIKPRGFDAMEEKLHADMREDARWIDNGMRHSFASYAVAKEENTARVSRWMGHMKPETIHKHYLDWLEKKDGKDYFSITSKRENIVKFKEAS